MGTKSGPRPPPASHQLGTNKGAAVTPPRTGGHLCKTNAAWAGSSYLRLSAGDSNPDPCFACHRTPHGLGKSCFALPTCLFRSSEEHSGVYSLTWLRKRWETVQISLQEGVNQNTQQNSAAILTPSSYLSCRRHEDQLRCPRLLTTLSITLLCFC